MEDALACEGVGQGELGGGAAEVEGGVGVGCGRVRAVVGLRGSGDGVAGVRERTLVPECGLEVVLVADGQRDGWRGGWRGAGSVHHGCEGARLCTTELLAEVAQLGALVVEAALQRCVLRVHGPPRVGVGGGLRLVEGQLVPLDAGVGKRVVVTASCGGWRGRRRGSGCAARLALVRGGGRGRGRAGRGQRGHGPCGGVWEAPGDVRGRRWWRRRLRLRQQECAVLLLQRLRQELAVGEMVSQLQVVVALLCYGRLQVRGVGLGVCRGVGSVLQTFLQAAELVLRRGELVHQRLRNAAQPRRTGGLQRRRRSRPPLLHRRRSDTAPPWWGGSCARASHRRRVVDDMAPDVA
ncbi:hypothetical protein NESM_000838100 [Novymonas esmeraldas]|uniref:Uncharacterized protein n=1 Tax=Novymonas esmeraldas TaxID=1808958 RepID=A0AAW0EYV8_9TRYP